MRTGPVYEEALRVYNGIDEILKKHGYERDGNIYRAVYPNQDTIVLFCHFGVTCVILAICSVFHLFCCGMVLRRSYIVNNPGYGGEKKRNSVFPCKLLWRHISSVCRGEPPAFSGRYCEIYDNMDERHD